MIVVDSGPVVAAMIPTDHFHGAVREFLRDNREPLALPTATIGEISHLIETRGGPHAAARLLLQLARGVYPLVEADAADFARAATLAERYADFPLGTVDALVVATAERLGVTTIFTLDKRHFGAIRPLHCERFTLVP